MTFLVKSHFVFSTSIAFVVNPLFGAELIFGMSSSAIHSADKKGLMCNVNTSKSYADFTFTVLKFLTCTKAFFELKQ